MTLYRRNKVEGEFDQTGTSAGVKYPGQYPGQYQREGFPKDKVPAPASHMEIEHGSKPIGLRRIGKKFIHLTSRLRKKYH